MRKLIFVISIFLLLAAAALPQQSKTAAPKKPDSCALVTKAEIQEAVGGTVADGAPNAGNSAMCDYSLDKSTPMIFIDENIACSLAFLIDVACVERFSSTGKGYARRIPVNEVNQPIFLIIVHTSRNTI